MHTSNLTTNWYKQRPFNRHSLLLRDLICDNNMISANYYYRQKLDYTYFKGHCRSYIDHIFTSEHLIDCLESCEIFDHYSYNTSDHLPVKVHINPIWAGGGGLSNEPAVCLCALANLILTLEY